MQNDFRGTPERKRPIEVLVVDENPKVLWGLERLIDGERPRMVVMGAVRSLDEVITALSERRPDVLVIDEALYEHAVDQDLTDTLVGLGSMKSRVLVLSTTPSVTSNERAKRLGAAAVLPKDGPAEVLLWEIERVSRDR